MSRSSCLYPLTQGRRHHSALQPPTIRKHQRRLSHHGAHSIRAHASAGHAATTAISLAPPSKLRRQYRSPRPHRRGGGCYSTGVGLQRHPGCCARRRSNSSAFVPLDQSHFSVSGIGGAIAEEPEEPPLRADIWVIMGAMWIGSFLAALDGTIVATIMNSVGSEFRVSKEVGWLEPAICSPRPPSSRSTAVPRTSLVARLRLSSPRSSSSSARSSAVSARPSGSCVPHVLSPVSVVAV